MTNDNEDNLRKQNGKCRTQGLNQRAATTVETFKNIKFQTTKDQKY